MSKIFPFFLALIFLSSDTFAVDNFSSETNEVKRVFDSANVQSRHSYCIENTLICQSLTIYRSMKSFSINFVNAHSTRGASEYFLIKENGNFKNYLDDLFDGKKRIDHVFPENQNIEIDFVNELPVIKRFKIIKHGTTFFAIASFSFKKDRALLSGTEYDSEDPSYSKSLNIVYKKIW